MSAGLVLWFSSYFRSTALLQSSHSAADSSLSVPHSPFQRNGPCGEKRDGVCAAEGEFWRICDHHETGCPVGWAQTGSGGSDAAALLVVFSLCAAKSRRSSCGRHNAQHRAASITVSCSCCGLAPLLRCSVAPTPGGPWSDGTTLRCQPFTCTFMLVVYSDTACLSWLISGD